MKNVSVTSNGYRQILGVQEGLAAARENADTIIEQLQVMHLKKSAKWIEQHSEEMLSYYRYTQTHRTRIKTNNPLERIIREIRRRTRVSSVPSRMVTRS